jgi:hypothetical protein
MKKLTLIALFAIAGLAASAQEKSILVGGSLGYTSESPSVGNSITRMTFAPTVGYQFNKNMTAGVKFGYQSLDAGTGTTLSQIQFLGFFRYEMPLTDVFSLYGDVQAGFITLNNSRGDGIGAGLTPGVLAHIGKGWGVTAEFANLSYASFGPSGAKSSTIDLNWVGNGFTFGIQKNFGLK